MTDRERILALREGWVDAHMEAARSGNQCLNGLRAMYEREARVRYPLPTIIRQREVNGWRCVPKQPEGWKLQLAGTDWLDITDAGRLAIADVCATPTEEVEA